MKLKKDDNICEIPNDMIQKISCDDGKMTFFILSELELKSGYKYQILLEFVENGDEHESNSFCLKGKIFQIYYLFILLCKIIGKSKILYLTLKAR